jgi:hypothetical protein
MFTLTGAALKLGLRIESRQIRNWILVLDLGTRDENHASCYTVNEEYFYQIGEVCSVCEYIFPKSLVKLYPILALLLFYINLSL